MKIQCKRGVVLSAIASACLILGALPSQASSPWSGGLNIWFAEWEINRPDGDINVGREPILMPYVAYTAGKVEYMVTAGLGDGYEYERRGMNREGERVDLRGVASFAVTDAVSAGVALHSIKTELSRIDSAVEVSRIGPEAIISYVRAIGSTGLSGAVSGYVGYYRWDAEGWFDDDGELFGYGLDAGLSYGSGRLTIRAGLRIEHFEDDVGNASRLPEAEFTGAYIGGGVAL